MLEDVEREQEERRKANALVDVQPKEQLPMGPPKAKSEEDEEETSPRLATNFEKVLDVPEATQ